MTRPASFTEAAGAPTPLLFISEGLLGCRAAKYNVLDRIPPENQFCGNGSSFAVFPSMTLNTTYRGCSWPLGKKVASPNTVPFIVLPRIASATVLRSRVFAASTARA